MITVGFDSSRKLFCLILCLLALGHTHLWATSDAYLGQTPPGNTPAVFAPGIVSTDGHETDIAFSPDMDEIYFTRTGANWYSVIYVLKYRNGSWSDPEQVSFSGDTSKNYPFVSPDGRHLFFDAAGPSGGQADRDLWVAAREGSDWGQPRRIGAPLNTSSVESFAGVSAGGSLYFCSRRSGGLGQADIYRASASREGYAEAENLGPEVNSQHNDFHPFVDPDERFVIFDSQRPGGKGANDLYVSVKGPDGSWSPAVNLGDVNTPAADMRPCVSPDGRYFFFCSTRGGQQDIYWVDMAALSLSTASDSGNQEAFTKVAEKGYYPAWTPDGSAIVFGSMGRAAYNVYAVNLRDGNTTKLTENGGYHPAVSPDGAYVTYDNRGAMGTVFKIPAGGGEAVRVTPEGTTGNFSCWSSDGETIVFSSQGDIWAMPSAGGDATRVISRDGNDIRPAISPDGSKIAFDSPQAGERGNLELWVYDTRDKTYTRLTNQPGRDMQAHWSPDGTMIAYASEKSGNLDVWIVRADGSDPVQVTRHPGMDVWPRWSPDGKTIAFGSDRDGSTDIWLVDLDKLLGAGNLQVGAAQQPIDVTFVANMGVYVETAGKKILFDALFRTPNPVYAAPPTDVLEKMETGKPPFDGVDLIVATHTHPDHFDPASVIRCLRHNEEAVFISTPEAKQAMESAGEDLSGLGERIITADLRPQQTKDYDVDGIGVRAIRTLHSGSRETPQNLMFLIAVGDRKIFHEGDSEGTVELFKQLALQREEIDVGLVHFWFVLNEGGQTILSQFLDPKQAVLLHSPLDRMEEFRGMVEDQAERFPSARFPTDAMTKFVY